MDNVMTVDRGRSFDVNRRALYHSLETGGGYESLSSFCAIMNIPCMSKQACSAHVEIILAGQEIEAHTELSKAAEQLHNLVKSKTISIPMWMRRMETRGSTCKEAKGVTYEAGGF